MAKKHPVGAAYPMDDPTFEPVTVENPDRHLPIMPELMRQDLWKWYKQMESMTWTAQESDLSEDRDDWDNEMSAGDRAFYEHIFALFGPADEKIMRNIAERFTSEFKWTEIVYFYRQQAQNEGVHSESYAQQIGALFDGERLKKMCCAVEQMPVVKKLMQWVDDWIGSDESLATRLAAFAFFEGVVFQGMFMSLQLLKERNLMSGVTTYNELISRDEGRHCAFACMLFRVYMRNTPPQDKVHRILGEVMSLVDEFFRTAIDAAKLAEGVSRDKLSSAPCPVIHITFEKMIRYVRHVADNVCVDMGLERLYNVSNPYPESSKLALNSVLKTNFFEDIVTQYNSSVDYAFNSNSARCVAVGTGVL